MNNITSFANRRVSVSSSKLNIGCQSFTRADVRKVASLSCLDSGEWSGSIHITMSGNRDLNIRSLREDETKTKRFEVLLCNLDLGRTTRRRFFSFVNRVAKQLKS